MLHCKDCEKYYKFGGDGSHGVCSVPASFFPVEAGMPCVYLNPPKKTCSMCSHFDNDTACMTQEADDTFASECGAFDDKGEWELEKILFQMLRNGTYSRQLIENICIEFEQTPEYLFVWEQREKEKEEDTTENIQEPAEVRELDDDELL